MAILTITESRATVIAGLQVLRLSSIASQTLAIGAGPVSSTPFHPDTKLIRVHTDAPCRITGGRDAGAADIPLSANQTEYFDVTESFLANTPFV